MLPSLLGVMELGPNNSYEWKDLGKLAQTWLQDAGGFAAVGLLVWFIYVFATPSPAVAGSRRQLVSKFQGAFGVAALVAYLIAAGFTIGVKMEDARFAEANALNKQAPQNANQSTPKRDPSWIDEGQSLCLALGGLLALLAFAEPFFRDTARLRWRRIYAIGRLSFKEAVRQRVVWVFLIVLLVFLFPATWFGFRQMKPEDVLKTTIGVVSFAMTVVLILTALLLASLSIPSDVKNQTIHTVVTKPVERFEIVAGRFLGYVALETLALFAMTAVSLVFILTSNVDEAARRESMKARVPVYGVLSFARERPDQGQRLQNFEGVDVGREYAYRKYIAGGRQSSHRGVWAFSNKGQLDNLAGLEAVPLEFAFDIYRTTKGFEGKGVGCSFDITTWKWDPAREEDYQRDMRGALGVYPRNVRYMDQAVSEEQARKNWERVNDIAKKYGRFEFRNYEIFDYRTYALMVPPGLFQNALEGDPPKDALTAGGDPVRLQVKVKCESESQLVGVAPLDLYFLESEGYFWANYFKGALGLWCRLTIVVALAVAASTYLAGVVSFLLALFLFVAGYFQEFIQGLAAGGNVGGGPFESFTRLVKGSPSAAELDKTPTVQIGLFGDDMFRWLLRRVINVIPDTERFTWSNFLEQGFNIGPGYIALNLLFLLAYLLPWALLAYYLMRSREIAA